MTDSNYKELNQINPGAGTREIEEHNLRFIFEFPDEDDIENSEITPDGDIKEIFNAFEGFDITRKPVFLEGVVERLNELGFHCALNDKKTISLEIQRRFKARTSEFASISEESNEELQKTWKTILNWIKSGNTSVVNRENNYTLCHVLEMNLEQTAVFFKKHFLAIPFNFKDPVDAIFFYCIKYKKNYSTIKQMLKKAKNFQAEDDFVNTAEIADRVMDIDDDEDFINYLSTHCYSKEQRNKEAKKFISDLKDRHMKKYSISSTKKYVEEVMGFDYQSQVKSLSTYSKERTDLYLPKEFSEGLPKDEDFSIIAKGKYMPPEKLRKIFIVLSLYNYFVESYKSEEYKSLTVSKIKERYRDFRDKTNERLLDCGLVQLYPKNLFDRIILLCAYSQNPIGVFHQISRLRYPESGEE